MGAFDNFQRVRQEIADRAEKEAQYEITSYKKEGDKQNAKQGNSSR